MQRIFQKGDFMVKTISKFSERLAELRIEKGLNKKETAAQLGIAPTTYNGWEGTERIPDIDTICRIADYYRVSTDYILGYSDYRENATNLFTGSNERFKLFYESLPENKKAPAAELIIKAEELLMRVMPSDNSNCCIKAYTTALEAAITHYNAVSDSIANNDIANYIKAQRAAENVLNGVLDTIAKGIIE